MRSESNDQEFDDLIRAAVGRDPARFDFQQWTASHQREIAEFQDGVREAPSHVVGWRGFGRMERKRITMRTFKIAVAAVVFIAVCLGVPHLGYRDHHGAAFAQALAQIDNAKTVTWKITFYLKATSEDGTRTWITTTTREQAYMSPGLYRDVTLDENGQIHHWTVTDTVNMCELTVNPNSKKAWVRGLAVTTSGPQGPFAWVAEQLKEPDLEWVGTRVTPEGAVNVFRRSFADRGNDEPWSYDFWIDAQTKRLVALHVPGADIFDPETDPLLASPVYDDWHTQEPACSVQYDIHFDADLDPSLFDLEPPAGYTVETEARAQVSEAEMIEYLGVMADFNDQTFPDDPYSIEAARINEIDAKAEAGRTPAEQRLLDTVHRYMMAGLNLMPTGHFIADRTVSDSFRYLGKGVKLGDADRIVCWYRLNGSETYRVVYGDLTIKDAQPEELPLPVEP